MVVGSTVVEQSPHHPRVKGLSPALATSSGKDKVTQKVFMRFLDKNIVKLNIKLQSKRTF